VGWRIQTMADEQERAVAQLRGTVR
jgi:hypothetical protein